MTALELEERALRREGNGSVPGSGLQTELVERTRGKNASAEASTKDALKLFVSVPSLLQAHPSSDTVARLFPLEPEYSGLRYWNSGVVEYWSAGMWKHFNPSLQYSGTPTPRGQILTRG